MVLIQYTQSQRLIKVLILSPTPHCSACSWFNSQCNRGCGKVQQRKKKHTKSLQISDLPSKTVLAKWDLGQMNLQCWVGGWVSCMYECSWFPSEICSKKSVIGRNILGCRPRLASVTWHPCGYFNFHSSMSHGMWSSRASLTVRYEIEKGLRAV